jgi:hypothetical protein
MRKCKLQKNSGGGIFCKNNPLRTSPEKTLNSEGIFMALRATKMPSDTAFLLKVRKLFLFWNRKVSELLTLSKNLYNVIGQQKLPNAGEAVVCGIFEDVMAGVGVAVDESLWEVGFPLFEEVGRKAKVTHAPADEGGLVLQKPEGVLDGIQASVRGVIGMQGDVFDKFVHGNAVFPGVVRENKALLHGRRQSIDGRHDVGHTREEIQSPNKKLPQNGNSAKSDP